MLIREYATATAEQVHESALLVTGSFPAFYDAYREWIKRSFKRSIERPSPGV
jgi:hypothetical protein